MELFNSLDYKSYLLARLNEDGRGSRSKLAEAISCHSAYLAQILNNNAHLSAEQAEKTNQFLGHTEEESDFFLLLVSYNRAGTEELKRRLKNQLNKILELRRNLKTRFAINEVLSEQQENIYYSHWVYAALHIACTIPQYQRIQALTQTLNLPTQMIKEYLDELIQMGLIDKKEDRFFPTSKQIHLGKESKMILQHHTNWRVMAIRDIDKKSSQSFHYSSIVSVSEKDFMIIYDKLAQFISELKKVVKESPEEKLCSLSFDWFNI